MKFFPLLRAALMRKKLRTALTFLSIFIAFMLYAFLGAIQEAFSAGVSMANQDRLITLLDIDPIVGADARAIVAEVSTKSAAA